MNDLKNYLERLPLHQKGWVQDLLLYIWHAEGGSDLSVYQLATRFQMSERQFYRKVKQNLQTTPNRLIRQIKMQKAKDLLEKGAYATVAEVAYNLGYNQPEYFSNVFQRTYGKRPSFYLKNW